MDPIQCFGCIGAGTVEDDHKDDEDPDTDATSEEGLCPVCLGAGTIVPAADFLCATADFRVTQDDATTRRLLDGVQKLGVLTGGFVVRDAMQEVFARKLAAGPAGPVQSLRHFQTLVCDKWLRRDRAAMAGTLNELDRQARKLAVHPTASRAVSVLAYAATACGAVNVCWPADPI